MAKTTQAKKASQTAKPTSKTSASSKAKKPVAKTRGGVLTTIYVLIILHGIFATYLGITTLKADYAGYRDGIFILMTLVSVACIVAAIGLWNWKKWGITLYVVACLVALAVHLAMTGAIFMVLYDILPVAILAYVINLQSKRELFT